MRIELAIDRAGFWWDGLGFSMHIAREARHPDDPAVWWKPAGERSRSFRLGGFQGVMTRAAQVA
jgi:hypothetical protein